MFASFHAPYRTVSCYPNIPLLQLKSALLHSISANAVTIRDIKDLDKTSS